MGRSRRRSVRVGLIVAGGLVGGSGVGLGQTTLPAPDAAEPSWLTGRLAIYANGGTQVASAELSDQFGYRVYGEEARFQSSHDISGGAVIDVGGSVRVWRELSIGGGYTHLGMAAVETTLTGEVPHPIQANTLRSVLTEVPPLDHREQVTHLFGAWRRPVNDTIAVSVFGGASFFNVTQGVVTNATVTEAGGPPFSAVTLDRVQGGDYRRNSIGGHAGFDVTYMVTPTVGVGFLTRFSKGAVEFPSAGAGTVSLDVGGLQVGGGLRIRF